MMQGKFNIAFRVDMLHSYFENNICDCVQFCASPATAAVFKRFDLKMRKKSNGFELYTNAASVASLLTYIQTVTGVSAFVFNMSTHNSHFTVFTDLPLNWLGQLHFDTQSVLNTVQDQVLQLGAQLETEVSNPILGTLLIHFEDIIKFATATVGAQFQISLKARATQWQYYIINRSALPLSGPKINSKLAIEFEGPQQVKIATGEQALFFSSGNQLIPLSNYPKYKLDLIDLPAASEDKPLSAATTSKTIFKGLPNPEVKQIGNVINNTNDLVSSPMYVYV